VFRRQKDASSDSYNEWHCLQANNLRKSHHGGLTCQIRLNIKKTSRKYPRWGSQGRTNYSSKKKSEWQLRTGVLRGTVLRTVVNERKAVDNSRYFFKKQSGGPKKHRDNTPRGPKEEGVPAGKASPKETRSINFPKRGRVGARRRNQEVRRSESRLHYLKNGQKGNFRRRDAGKQKKSARVGKSRGEGCFCGGVTSYAPLGA